MTGQINMGNNKITNLADPTQDDDATTKKYDNSGYSRARTMTGDIDMNNNFITNLPVPSQDVDAATNKYVDDEVGKSSGLPNALLKSGGTMTGVLSVGNHLITNIATPKHASDGTNKAYVDKFLPLSGGVMAGDLNMSNNFIGGLPQPIHDNQAATKKYVDEEAGDILFDTRAANNPPPPWDGTISGSSGLYGVMSSSGVQPPVYGSTLSPFIGFHMWSSDINENIKNQGPIIIDPPRGKKIVRGYGLERPVGQLQPGQFIRLSPNLVHKLTANIWGTSGATFHWVNANPLQPGVFSQDNMEIGSVGRINLEPAISVAASENIITVSLHLNFGDNKKAVTLTHRSAQIEVLGAYKKGYFQVT